MRTEATVDLPRRPKAPALTRARGGAWVCSIAHISAEYELPTLLLNKNRVLPSTYIDNGKSLL